MVSPIFRFVFVRTSLNRHIHVTAVSGKNYASRQGKMMAKLMMGSIRKRKNWYNFEKQVQAPLIPSKTHGPNAQGLRRVDVLNKLLMSSITDLLSTGEVASDIVGQGVSISRVKVAPDFSIVNIFWSGKGKSPDVDLEGLLDKTAYKLRHELSQLHVMSVVPRIAFVADKRHFHFEEVERRLARVNFDYQYGVDCLSELQSDFSLNRPLNGEIEVKIQELEDDVDPPLPPMTHDVLGLDHEKIMKKLLIKVQKSRALHRCHPDIDPWSNIRGRDTSVSSEREVMPVDFANFIKKRKISKLKARKQMDKSSPETELLAAESDLREEYVDIEDGDFIEDIKDY